METTEFQMPGDIIERPTVPSAPTAQSPIATLLQPVDLNAWENDTDIHMVVDGIYFNVTEFCENVGIFLLFSYITYDFGDNMIVIFLLCCR